MKTQIIDAMPQEGQCLQLTSDMMAKLEPAVESLRSGQVVAMPTETVYGLAANAFDEEAVKKIYLAKGRPSDNPLIVHVSSRSMLNLVSASVPDAVTAGLATVAVRMPSHPIARYLIERSGCPLAAPSANASGKPSPTLASHVADDLCGRIPWIINAGPCSSGIESTVVNLLHSPPSILRPGSITLELLRELVPKITVHVPACSRQHDPSTAAAVQMSSETPLAPGMKYAHYAPDAKLILLAIEDRDERQQAMQQLHEWARSQRLSVGLLATTRESLVQSEPYVEHAFLLGDGTQAPEAIAHDLFRDMRALDSLKVGLIIMDTVEEANEGLAIMNRIGKAATCIVQSKASLHQACLALLSK